MQYAFGIKWMDIRCFIRNNIRVKSEKSTRSLAIMALRNPKRTSDLNPFLLPKLSELLLELRYMAIAQRAEKEGNMVMIHSHSHDQGFHENLQTP